MTLTYDYDLKYSEIFTKWNHLLFIALSTDEENMQNVLIFMIAINALVLVSRYWLAITGAVMANINI